jgi:uncharacterized membrane protein YagU involved in acid resistance
MGYFIVGNHVWHFQKELTTCTSTMFVRKELMYQVAIIHHNVSRVRRVTFNFINEIYPIKVVYLLRSANKGLLNVTTVHSVALIFLPPYKFPWSSETRSPGKN